MTYTVTVAAAHQLTPDVKQFRLVGDEPFEFEPGQHTTVRFEDDGEQVVRPYTPTNRPGTDELTLAVKRYEGGTASVYMHERGRGDEVELGSFEGNHLRDPRRERRLRRHRNGNHADGSDAQAVRSRRERRRALLLRREEPGHLIYRETLEQIAAEQANVELTLVLSEEDWNGPTGHVQDHLLDRLDPEGRQFYVCGVPEMVVDTADRLDDAGVPDDRIVTEGWEEGEVSDD